MVHEKGLVSMKLNNSAAEIYVPDAAAVEYALTRTTDLCFAAHQDDIEIMACGPILDCCERKDKWFAGVVVTDGAGSPRCGPYADHTDEDMKRIRVKEQKNAAMIGGYAAQFFLSYQSGEVKKPDNQTLIHELKDIILACAPEVIYTHNLADKHDTHIAVVLNVIRALKLIPRDKRPKKVFSMEVWRSLDWLCDGDKTPFDTSARPNIAAALLGVYDSQISGGKRYDLAAAGRRAANATFFQSHGVDQSDSLSFGLDITPLVDQDITPADFIGGYIDRFGDEVRGRVSSLSE